MTHEHEIIFRVKKTRAFSIQVVRKESSSNRGGIHSKEREEYKGN